jgi:hypothetical protein
MADKHTPGPWKAELSCVGEYRGLEIKGKNGQWIGNVHANKNRDDRIPQAEANARLIAAAPELLDVLMLVEERFGAHCADPLPLDLCELIVAALSKARGEQV